MALHPTRGYRFSRFSEVETPTSRFRIFHPLGAGGNGECHAALSIQGPLAGDLFCLKFLTRLTQEGKYRFQQEMEFLRTNPGPSLARVYDNGVTQVGGGESPFYASDLFPQTLRDRMYSGRLRFSESLLFSVQLLAALKHLAHHVHRDIKPSNIFVYGHNAVLGDFGLLRKSAETGDRADKRDLLRSVKAAMPIGYRTPDAIRYLRDDVPLTPRADIYQVGLVIAEMFIGGRIQRSVTWGQKLDPIEFERPLRVEGRMGAQVTRVLERMLNSEPDLRPSADDSLDDFQRILNEYLRAEVELCGESI